MTEIRAKKLRKSQSFAHFQVIIAKKKNDMKIIIKGQINIAVNGEY